MLHYKGFSISRWTNNSVFFLKYAVFLSECPPEKPSDPDQCLKQGDMAELGITTHWFWLADYAESNTNTHTPLVTELKLI